MGRNVSRAIDSVIQKKLNSLKTLKKDVQSLYEYSKSINSRRSELYKFYFQEEQGDMGTKVDLYNNKFYNFYENKIKKTPCKFNLLRMFKPGELLTSIAGV